MKFGEPLIAGRLLKRYKRFLADVQLEDGRCVTAHCPNPGAMLGLTEPGTPVWLSFQGDPRRKLSYTWEMAWCENVYIGMNTQTPNKLVREALQEKKIAPVKDYPNINSEVMCGSHMRCDFYLQGASGASCYLEVKNVHFKKGNCAYFPDSVTQRGARHVETLTLLKQRENIRAMIVYVIQREDIEACSVAQDIDPRYAQAVREALRCGVEMYAYTCHVSLKEIVLQTPVPFYQG